MGESWRDFVDSWNRHLEKQVDQTISIHDYSFLPNFEQTFATFGCILLLYLALNLPLTWSQTQLYLPLYLSWPTGLY